MLFAYLFVVIVHFVVCNIKSGYMSAMIYWRKFEIVSQLGGMNILLQWVIRGRAFTLLDDSLDRFHCIPIISNFSDMFWIGPLQLFCFSSKDIFASADAQLAKKVDHSHVQITDCVVVPLSYFVVGNRKKIELLSASFRMFFYSKKKQEMTSFLNIYFKFVTWRLLPFTL